MNNKYYQWRINYVINKHFDFTEWLLRNGADIYSDASLSQGEVFKFKMSNGLGILYKTGKCNPFFNRMATVFKRQSTGEVK